MSPVFRSLALGLLLLVPAAAHAQAPVLTSISDVTLNAGGTATITVVAFDPNNDAITLTSSLPAFATLNAPTTGAGVVATTITLLPTSTGTFNGTVTATAGGQTDTEDFTITVNSAGTNTGPMVTAPSLMTVVEGQTVTMVVTAADANGDAISSLLATGLPTGATFTANGSNTSGTLTWTPTSTQAGNYDVTFTASNALQGSTTTHFVVLESGAGNAACPVITLAPTYCVDEGQLLTFNVTATDADGGNLDITASGVPTGATLVDNNNGTATFTWTPTSTQSGTYVLTVMVNDNQGCTQAAMTTITVNEPGGNDCPVLTVVPATLTVVEGQFFAFNISVSDPDGGNVDLTASGVPTGATFVDNNNNTGRLTWTPSSTQAGTYTITFTANDNEGCTRTATLTVTVNEGTANQCPTISVPSTLAVVEGQSLNFTVTTSDPDGGAVTLTASGVPSGATFTPATGAFTWTPSGTQSGTYTVVFTANDNEGCTQTATTVITVTEPGQNQCPTITAPAALTVTEGQAVNFTVTSSDPDGGSVTLSATGVPSGATFTAGTGVFTWTPSGTQSGTHAVTFISDDNEGCTQMATTVITVNEPGGNQCPTITAPATQTVAEGQTVAFTVTASDPDGGTVTLTASGMPSGATFNGGTGFFGWTPTSTQSGTYTVTFTADDNEGCTQTATTVITVNDVGGGGAGTGTGTIIGRFNTHRRFICFRVEPTNGSFDLRNVSLGSLELSFNGQTLHALSGKTHLEFECDDDDGDCDECEDDDEDRNGDDCEHDDDGDCDVSHLRVCFENSDLRDFFGEDDFMDQIVNATITGDLTTGGSITITLDGGKFANGGPGRGQNGKGKMHAKVSPNPLNPSTQLSFTLASSGRIRVAVYDTQGRLVRTLLNETRAAGDHVILWDGTDSRGGKVSSGVYFFRLDAAEGSETVRVTVLK